MKTIFLIRHSKPLKGIDNTSNIDDLQLQNEKQILSIEGENIAKKLSECKELQNIDVLYSSNYVRAISTAKYVAAINNLNINIDSRLGERRFGHKTLDDFKPDFFKKQFTDWNYKYGTGECLNEVNKRMRESLSEIIEHNIDKKIAIVTHGMAITCLLKTWCDIEYDSINDIATLYFNNKPLPIHQIKFCQIFKLEFDDDNKLLSIEVVE